MANAGMKNNAHPTDLLPDYLLGALSPEEVGGLEAHLEHCATCREELARLAAPVVPLAEGLPQAQPPERVWETLRMRFAQELSERPENVTVLAQPARISTRLAYPWLLAACVALAVTGGSLLWGVRNYGAYQQASAETRLLTTFLAQPQVQKVALENVIGSDRRESPGSVLLTPEGDALFVLADAAPRGRAYQAWGHASSEWDPERGEELTSLGLSRSNVLEVATSGFASLYLSVEPVGGSPQPTEPLSKLSLLRARPDAVLELDSPQEGSTLTSDSVIVSGTVEEGVTDLRYSVGGETTDIAFANNRFTFTVTGLSAGENTLTVTATTADGKTASASVNVEYTPPE